MKSISLLEYRTLLIIKCCSTVLAVFTLLYTLEMFFFDLFLYENASGVQNRYHFYAFLRLMDTLCVLFILVALQCKSVPIRLFISFSNDFWTSFFLFPSFFYILLISWISVIPSSFFIKRNIYRTQSIIYIILLILTQILSFIYTLYYGSLIKKCISWSTSLFVDPTLKNQSILK